MTSSARWPASVPLEEAMRIRKMEQRIARSYLRVKYKELDADALELAVSHALPDTNTQVKTKTAQAVYDRLFIAVAYVLGASVSQLARMFDYSRGGIYSIVRSRYNKASEIRLEHHPSVEGLQILHKFFMEMLRDDPLVFDGLMLSEIAKTLEPLIEEEPDV